MANVRSSPAPKPSTSEVLVKKRLGGASNRSLANIMLKSQEDLRALRRSGVGGVGALVAKNLSKLPQFFAKRV